MRSLFFTAVITLISSGIGNAQIKFQKVYGGGQKESGNSVIEPAAGGYLICGETESYGPGKEVYLVRTNVDGDTLWVKVHGGTGADEGRWVEQTTDNGFIIAGTTTSWGAGQSDVLLMKTDVNGTLQWTKVFGTNNFEHGNCVKQTADGGYIVVGDIFTVNNGYDFFVIKTDQNGDTLWTKIIGGGQEDVPWEVVESSGGGYAIIGQTVSFTYGNVDIFLVKLDANGNVSWDKHYGDIMNEYGYTILETAANGYLIGGATQSFGAGNYDFCLIETDASGDTLWTKAYGGADEDFGSNAKQTFDGGYVLSGYTRSFSAIFEDILVVKTSSSGNMEWAMRYGVGGNGYEQGNSIIQASSDSGYVVTAYTDSYGAGFGDAQLAKIQPDGLTGCNEDAPPVIMNGTQLKVGPGASASAGGATVTSPNASSAWPTITVETMCYCNMPLPFASYTWLDNGLTVDFTDASANATGWAWDFGDGSPIDNNQNPSHTYATDSTYYVCLTVNNPCGQHTSCDSVDVYAQGVEGNKLLESILCYPNPAHDKLSVHLNLESTQTIAIQIQSILGNIVYNKLNMQGVGKIEQSIDISDMTPGVYTISIHTKEQTTTRKLVVQ